MAEIQPAGRPASAAWPLRSALFALAVGLLVSAAVFGLLRRYEAQAAVHHFQNHADTLAETMQRQIDMAVEMVDSVGALYDASERVRREEFRRFVEAQLDRHREVQALMWLPRVTAAERAQHEAGVRAEGMQDYALTEFSPEDGLQVLSPREEYFPVQFVEPLADNIELPGVDVAAHPLRRQAMEQARDSGGMAASAVVTLLQKRGGRQGFVIYRPVYRHMEIPPDMAARRQLLRGYAAGAFRLAELLAGAQHIAGAEHIAFELYGMTEERPLYRSLQPPAAASPLFSETRLHLPGRSWRVVFTPTPEYLAQHYGVGTWLVLVLGIVLTLLVSYHLYSTTRRALRLEQANAALAGSQEQIEHAHREWMDAFDAMPDPIFLHDAQGRVMRANRAYAERAGRDFSAIIGQPYWQVFPPGPGPTAACLLGQQEEGQAEEEIRTADGRLYLARLFAIRDAAGSYRYSIHALRDITAQRAMEQRLESEQARAQRYLDIAAVMLLALDREARITLINRAGCEILGYSEQALLGEDWLERFIPAEEREQVQEIFRTNIRGEPVRYAENWIMRRDGERRLIAWQNAVLRDSSGEITGTLSSGMDITERHRLEQALRESQQRLQVVFDTARDGILVAELATQRFVLANRAIADLLGYSEAELYWLGIDAIHPEDELQRVRDIFARQARGEFSLARDIPLRRRDGSTAYADVNAAPVELDGRPCLLGIFHDTSERRAMEATLKAREEQLVLALQGSSDGLWDWDVEQGTVYYSPRWKALLGHSDEEIGDSFDEWQRRVHPDDLPAALDEIQAVLAGTGDQLQVEHRMRHKAGHWVWIQSRAHVVRDAAGKPQRLVGTHEDVTARREAEDRAKALAFQLQERLKESRCLYRVAQLAEDVETPLPQLLQQAVELLPQGWQYPEETVARIHYQGRVFISPGFVEGPWCLSAIIQAGGAEVGSVEVCYTGERPAEDEGPFFHEERALLEAVADQLGQIIDLRLGRQTLARLNRVLRTLSLSNRALVYAPSETALEQEVCEVLVREAGYRATWIGHRQNDGGLHAMAWSGDDVPGSRDIACPQHDSIQRLICEAMDSGELRQGGLAEHETCPMCHTTQADTSTIALPLQANGKALGVLFVCAGQTEGFAPAEVELLQELADDLAYGIRMRRTTGERDIARAELAGILIKTVSVIALTVEKRDPYTAGHMQRVASLAMAIGREMGLDEGTITGLQMGALIHDIGKIYIPAEILNRPGRLSQVEFDLIKTHPQVGYDIVQEIDFPWPVDKMIVQHHERLDGSGYPNGLHGAEICLEARILAVADVVEAMASHRPYRASLPLQNALDEIEQYRGSRYDTAVVDVCLRLFREQGFSWQVEADA